MDAAAIRAAAQERAHEAVEAQAASPLDGETALRTVWVGHVPDESASDQVLRRLFHQHGTVVSISLRPKPGTGKSWALVTFTDAGSAQRDIAAPSELKVRAADVQAQLSTVHSAVAGHVVNVSVR